jgi:hypothetical protein
MLYCKLSYRTVSFFTYLQVQSLSPAELKRSANSICMDDWVAHGEFDTFQQQTFFAKQGGSSLPNKIKSIFKITASCCESNLEHGTNRQKAQVAQVIIVSFVFNKKCSLFSELASPVLCVLLFVGTYYRLFIAESYKCSTRGD